MATVSPFPLIITLNVDGLNFSIRRHRVGKWIIKKIFNYILFIRDSPTRLMAYIGESESIKIRYSLQIVT